MQMIFFMVDSRHKQVKDSLKVKVSLITKYGHVS